MVAINQVQSKFCSEQLKNTDIDTEDAIKNGANEIDYVINITELKNKNYAYIKEEMKQMVDTCHKYHVLCKVIFENCYLTKEEIKKISRNCERN